MKKRLIIIIAIICIIVASIPIIFYIIGDKNDDEPQIENAMGVWWWNDDLDAEMYLNFACANGINEIYYCSSEFGEKTSRFISSANRLGVEVYWLQGEYEWLDDSSSLLAKIEDYCKYQTDYPNSKFSGIHLDIEPHQNPDFESKRAELILKLIELANLLKQSYPNISFDYDIPFWLDDDISYKESSHPAYQHIIDIADRVFVMSYRDSAEAIIRVAEDELNYALAAGKILILSVECSSNEGDNVSFAEEGRIVLKSELLKIRQRFTENVGLSIHHIKSFYDMKD